MKWVCVFRPEPSTVSRIFQGLEEPGCRGCSPGLSSLGLMAPGLPAAGQPLTVARYLLSSSSKHYPLYSLNVASMWLKLGRLYLGLENKAAGERALKKVRL